MGDGSVCITGWAKLGGLVHVQLEVYVSVMGECLDGVFGCGMLVIGFVLCVWWLYCSCTVVGRFSSRHSVGGIQGGIFSEDSKWMEGGE